MNLRTSLASLAGDLAHWGTTRLLHRGGGNIPGAVALKLDPQVIASLGSSLRSSAVVTGTNGKTTTTGLLADALAAGGRAAQPSPAAGSPASGVICNRAGNNMESGIAAALVLERHGEPGRLGCFECDELYTVRVLPQLKPRVFILLNLFRDQLDRYGEIDHTQDVIAEALRKSPSTTLIYNADDPLCAAIAGRVDNPTLGFGIDEPTGLEADRISDSRFCARCNAPLDYDYVHYGQLGSYHCPSCGWKRPELAFAIRNVTLGCRAGAGYEFDIVDQRGQLGASNAAATSAPAQPAASSASFSPKTYHLSCKYNGLYMVYNIAAAFCGALTMGVSTAAFQDVLNTYEPAGARGKTYEFGSILATANLAKNPTGFDRMIQQIRVEDGRAMAFFLNDNDADGHDISWIWDVDFERLFPQLSRAWEAGELTQVYVGGTRKEELLVRLKYAQIPAEMVNGIEDALERLSKLAAARTNHADGSNTLVPSSNDPLKLHIVANYTAFPPVVADLEQMAQDGWTAAAASPATKAVKVASCTAQATPDPGFSLDRPLRIVHLYPDALNLYGDGGNIASLQKRCEWRSIPVRVDQVMMGQPLDLSDADVVLLGGGADRDQLAVCKELLRQREEVARYVADGGMLLAICGGYQLLGRFYEMGAEHERIEGLGILDLETTAGATRLIGNVAISSPICDAKIVGFENHAGRTVLGASENPLGQALVHGTGNNGEDGGEGVLHQGVVGTYFHGPLLPKNPGVTDYLLTGALRRRGIMAELAPLDDTAETLAHDVALKIAHT